MADIGSIRLHLERSRCKLGPEHDARHFQPFANNSCALPLARPGPARTSDATQHSFREGCIISPVRPFRLATGELHPMACEDD